MRSHSERVKSLLQSQVTNQPSHHQIQIQVSLSLSLSTHYHFMIETLRRNCHKVQSRDWLLIEKLIQSEIEMYQNFFPCIQLFYCLIELIKTLISQTDQL